MLMSAGPLLANTPPSPPEPAQGVEVDQLYAALKAMLESRASQYSAKIDTPQGKLFQIGQASAVIAPVETLNMTDLGLLGLLEVGGPFTIQGTELPPGSYRMELGGTLQQMLLYLRDSRGNRVVSIPVDFSSNFTFEGFGGQVGTSGFRNRPPVSPLRVIGPNISINFTLTRTPPYIQNLRTCVGFVIPFSSGAFNIRFCF
jgi:hypothetical protein